MEDQLIKTLLDTELWVLVHRVRENDTYTLNSNMIGYSAGRYRIEIDKLKKKSKGFLYKVRIYWTPYNPNNLVGEGRVTNYEELKAIIKKVNIELLNLERKVKK